MTYDEIYGRQTSLTDIDAGTTTYQYNAYGQLVSQTDAQGQQITMQYDLAGRISQKTTPEGTTTYSYATSGGGKGQVASITGPDATVTYGYDSYGRAITQTTQVDGNAYSTQYGFDSYGRLYSIDYPSGFGVRRSYNSRGYLTYVENHDLSETFFEATSANAFGQYTQYSRGNGTTTFNNFNDYGLPTNTHTPGVQNLSTSFDLSSGNLLSRTDHRKGRTEAFTYDAQNRLEDYQVSGQAALSVSYSSAGNITHKTDIGNYLYDGTAHAVTGVTDPDDLIPTYDQNISYTSGHDPASITEDDWQLDFTYGPEQSQRIKTVLTDPNGNTRTRYYFGSYEKQVSSGGTQHIHYVSDGDGLCAIVVRDDNGNSDSYYAYTDHLGSIVTLTDDDGYIEAEQNFDPWGRARNPNTWTYSNLPTQPDWLYRGYTGHEGMPEFGLIHMNGRMYDPLLGRMLSPDNYVHGGLGADGFNRYAYAGNNPLKYVDPSGEEPITLSAILIGAAIGAGVGAGTSAIMYTVMTPILGGQLSWQGLGRAVLMGAISGAIFGGIGAVAASASSAAGQNIALGVLRQSAGNIGARLIMGEELTAGMVAGGIVSGLVNGAIPGFSGVEGGAFANITAELMHNTGRGMLSGGMGGMVGAAFDGQDLGEGLANGMIAGMFSAAANTVITVSALGAAYVPSRVYANEEVWKSYAPVYRRGNFITRALFKGGGIALGRNLVTYELSARDGLKYRINHTDFNHSLRAHETGHYLQQLNLGWGGQLARTLKDYFTVGFANTYTIPGTLEHDANMHSLSTLGYWYDPYGIRRTTP